MSRALFQAPKSTRSRKATSTSSRPSRGNVAPSATTPRKYERNGRPVLPYGPVPMSVAEPRQWSWSPSFSSTEPIGALPWRQRRFRRVVSRETLHTTIGTTESSWVNQHLSYKSEPQGGYPLGATSSSA
jgi:hypothetical protein